MLGVDTAMHTTTWPKIIKIQLSHAKLLIAIGGIAKKKKERKKVFHTGKTAQERKVGSKYRGDKK